GDISERCFHQKFGGHRVGCGCSDLLPLSLIVAKEEGLVPNDSSAEGCSKSILQAWRKCAGRLAEWITCKIRVARTEVIHATVELVCARLCLRCDNRRN